LYNQEPGTSIAVPTLGAENIGQLVPVGIIPLEVGESWKARLKAGKDVTVKLLVNAISETRETWNIIAETKEGDPNKVVMLGAHLDSVQQGPGINDDGTGTAALLEIMTSVQKYGGFPHKIRFAWWGAEESGLVGSLYYTSHLSEAEADKIKYYFNYDMIGSPQPEFDIASNNNSGIGPQLLEEYLVTKGKNVSHGYVQSPSPSHHLSLADKPSQRIRHRLRFCRLHRARHPVYGAAHGRRRTVRCVLPPSLRRLGQHPLGRIHGQCQSGSARSGQTGLLARGSAAPPEDEPQPPYPSWRCAELSEMGGRGERGDAWA